MPSNPWVALGWRKPGDIKIRLPETLAKFGIDFDATGARRVLPAENAIELKDGRRLPYDYLVIAVGSFIRRPDPCGNSTKRWQKRPAR